VPRCRGNGANMLGSLGSCDGEVFGFGADARGGAIWIQDFVREDVGEGKDMLVGRGAILDAGKISARGCSEIAIP
jgi:hypothetical protein